ncbi:MAG TPA: hypothetical protein VGG39_23605 [Polyangiaceae bacterium]|jgi:hypothetical protein
MKVIEAELTAEMPKGAPQANQQLRNVDYDMEIPSGIPSVLRISTKVSQQGTRRDGDGVRTWLVPLVFVKYMLVAE